jgi:hypothetical protein
VYVEGAQKAHARNFPDRMFYLSSILLSFLENDIFQMPSVVVSKKDGFMIVFMA